MSINDKKNLGRRHYDNEFIFDAEEQRMLDNLYTNERDELFKDPGNPLNTRKSIEDEMYDIFREKEFDELSVQSSPTVTPRLKFWVPEFIDFHQVLDYGAKKHGDVNWLEPNGNTVDHKTNYNSMFHHLAEGFSGKTVDPESGLHPLLHLITRAQIAYVRYQRGLVHKKDIK